MKQNVKENSREQRSSKEVAKKSGRGLEKGGETVLNNAVKQSKRGPEKGGEI